MDPRPVPELPSDVQVELTARREELEATLVDELNQSWAEYLSRYTEAVLGTGPPLPNPEQFLFPPLVRYGLALFDAFAGAWLKVDPTPTTADYLSWLRTPLRDSTTTMVEGWMLGTCPDAVAIDAEARQVIVALWRVDQGERFRGELAKATARQELHWRPIGIRTLAPAADGEPLGAANEEALSAESGRAGAAPVAILNTEAGEKRFADDRHRAGAALLEEIIRNAWDPKKDKIDDFLDEHTKGAGFRRTALLNYRSGRSAGSRVRPLVEAWIITEAQRIGLPIPPEINSRIDSDSRIDSRMRKN